VKDFWKRLGASCYYPGVRTRCADVWQVSPSHSMAGMVAPRDAAVTASHNRSRFFVPLACLVCYALAQVSCAVWLRNAYVLWDTSERL